MPTEREEAEDLATRYRQKYDAGGSPLAEIADDCVCECGNVARDHNRTTRGVGSCLMAGCYCTQFKHKVASAEE